MKKIKKTIAIIYLTIYNYNIRLLNTCANSNAYIIGISRTL
jgi:hypothetical protein